MRLRLRSATPEEPADEEIPPPNMSDKPPPLPLCSRIDMIRKKLDSTRSTWRTILSTVTLWFSLRYRASVSRRALLRGSVCRVCPIRAGLYPIHTGSIMSGSSASSCEADEPGQPGHGARRDRVEAVADLLGPGPAQDRIVQAELRDDVGQPVDPPLHRFNKRHL